PAGGRPHRGTTPGSRPAGQSPPRPGRSSRPARCSPPRHTPATPRRQARGRSRRRVAVVARQRREILCVSLVAYRRQRTEAGPDPIDVLVAQPVPQLSQPYPEVVRAHLATQHLGDEPRRIVPRPLRVLRHVVRQTDRDSSSHTFTISTAYFGPSTRQPPS